MPTLLHAWCKTYNHAVSFAFIRAAHILSFMLLIHSCSSFILSFIHAAHSFWSFILHPCAAQSFSPSSIQLCKWRQDLYLTSGDTTGCTTPAAASTTATATTTAASTTPATTFTTAPASTTAASTTALASI